MKFITKIKTNENARKSFLASCGWGTLIGVFFAVATWISGWLGGKLGESIVDYIYS